MVFFGHFAKAVVGQNGKKMAHFWAQLQCQKDRENILDDDLRLLCGQKNARQTCCEYKRR